MNSPIPNQTNNPNINPLPTSKFTRISDWIKSHKKLILFIMAVVFLFGILIFTIFQIFKDRIFPKLTPQTPTTQSPLQEENAPLIQLQTSKDTYSLNEKIVIKAVANSQGQAVRAFDVLVAYDGEALSLTDKKSPTKPEFEYYSSNTGTLLQTTAVQKPDVSQDQVLNNVPLFEFEFTPKKAGKTAFKLIFVPNATNDSNLIDSNSKDILGIARGVEVTIK